MSTSMVACSGDLRDVAHFLDGGSYGNCQACEAIFVDG